MAVIYCNNYKMLIYCYKIILNNYYYCRSVYFSIVYNIYIY